MIRTGPILLFQLSSHPYLCTCQIRKQSDKKVLSLNPKYEKIYFFSYLGGKTSFQSRHMYKKEKK